jgi:hypothetical protein
VKSCTIHGEENVEGKRGKKMKRLIALLAGLTVFSSFMTMSFAAESDVPLVSEAPNGQWEDAGVVPVYTVNQKETVTTTTLAPNENIYTTVLPLDKDRVSGYDDGGDVTYTTSLPIDKDRVSDYDDGTVTTTTLAPDEDEKFTQTSPSQSETQTTTTTEPPVDEFKTVPYLIGDYNGDKWVDPADYGILEEKIAEFDGVYLQSSLLEDALFDINRDGHYNEGDLKFLRQMIDGDIPLRILEWNPRATIVAGYTELTSDSKNYPSYVKNDVDGDGDVDFNDYETLKAYLNGELNFAVFYPWMKVMFDVDDSGFIDNSDANELLRILRVNGRNYCFVMDSTDTIVAYYGINDYAEHIGIVGDLNKDGFVDYADYELMKEVSGAETQEWNPFEKIYVRDVNMNGKSDSEDLSALEKVISRKEPVYAFRWNEEIGRPSEYFILREAKTSVWGNTERYILGDLNGNEEIDQEDIDTIQWYVDGKFSSIPSALIIALMDIDRNGTVNETDITVLNNMLIGNVPTYMFSWDVDNEIPLEYFGFNNPGESYVYGDLDGDLIVGMSDFVLLCKIIDGNLDVESASQEIQADVDRKDGISGNDLSAMIDVISGKAPIYAFNSYTYGEYGILFANEYFLVADEYFPTLATYMVGDANRDYKLDNRDYQELKAWLNGEFDSLGTPLLMAKFDIDMNGNVDDSDKRLMEEILNGNMPVHGFKWNIYSEIVMYYFVIQDIPRQYETYILGDLDFNKVVDEADYVLLKELYNKDYPTPLEQALMNVSRTGYFEPRYDYAAMEKIVKGNAPVYAFDWGVSTEYTAGYYLYDYQGEFKLFGDLDGNKIIDKNDYFLFKEEVDEAEIDYTEYADFFVNDGRQPRYYPEYDANADGWVYPDDLETLGEIIDGEAPTYGYSIDSEGLIDNYFVWKEAAVDITYIVGDIDRNGKLDFEDSNLFKFMLEREDGTVSPSWDIVDDYIRDVDRDGDIDNDDLKTLNLIKLSTNPAYAFKVAGDYGYITPYFVYDNFEEFYIVGDVNFDKILDQTDYDLMVMYLESDTDIWAPLEKIYARDVNMDGEFNKKDLPVLQGILDGFYDIYGFYWDTDNEKPLEYFVYKTISPTPEQIKTFYVGDLNADNAVNYQDYDLLNAFLKGESDAAPIDIYVMDVDRNGIRNADDLSVLYDVMSGLAPIYGFYWNWWTDEFISYFIYKDVEPSAFILGDINFDKKLDKTDYNMLERSLRDMIVTVENAGTNKLKDFYLLDVDRDGFVSSADLDALKAAIEGYADIYAFWWDGESQTAYDYFVYENAKDSVLYIVGDINKDGEVNYNDRALLKDFLKMDVLLWEKWSLLDSLYTRDVNMDGVVNQDDVTAMEDVVAGLAEVYAFYWDNFNQVPKEYFVYTNYPPLDKERIYIEETEVFPSYADIDAGTTITALPLFIVSETDTKGFTAYLTVNGEVTDISLEQNPDFPFVEELTAITKMSDGTYRIMVTYEDALPLYLDSMSRLPYAALNLIVTLPVEESRTISFKLDNVNLIKDNGDILTDFTIGGSSSTITLTVINVILCGDLNEDDNLSLSDLVMLYQFINGDRIFTDYQFAAADIDRNSIINATDFTIFKREFLRK